MRIKSKLISIYLIGAVMTVITIVFVLMAYSSIREDFTIVMNQPIKKLDALKRIERQTLSVLASTSDLGLLMAEEKEESHSKIFSRTDNNFNEEKKSEKDFDFSEKSEEVENEKKEFFESANNLKLSISEFEGLVNSNLENEEANFLEIKSTSEKLILECLNFIKLKEADVSGESILEKKEQLEEIESKILVEIDKLNKLQHLELQKKQSHVESTISGSINNTIIIFIFALVLTVITGFAVSNSIIKSINNLKQASYEIGNGNLEIQIDTKGKDEISELATDFQKMTAQLRNSQTEILTAKSFVENLFNSMADMVLAVDDDGVIQRVNDSTLNILGYNEVEIVGKQVSILTQKETFLTEDEFEFMLKNRELVEVEKEFVRKNGERFPALISSSLLHGKKAAAVVVAKDISKLKKDEKRLIEYTLKLKQSNRELEDFAYVASHDLQEPLRKIQAFGDRLIRKCADNLSEEGKNYIQRMGAAAGRMQSLINDLLTFSRVTTKAQPFEKVDVRKVTDEVISDLEVRIEETRSTIEIGELPQVDADPVQMRQLMQNLIGNALKFTQSGQNPKIKIYSQEYSDKSASFLMDGKIVETTGSPDRMCQIVVQDNGIGFNEKYLDRIFTVFQRLHGRTEYEGSGVGLAVCRKIVERHRGTITAKSKEGEGSMFMITLPVNQTQEETLNNERL